MKGRKGERRKERCEGEKEQEGMRERRRKGR